MEVEIMFVIVAYDVSTESKFGKGRLRRVAKKCQEYGQRVQNSVFECSIDYGQYLRLKHDLLEIINQEEDNIRFYNIGNKFETKIESLHFQASLGVRLYFLFHCLTAAI